MSEVQFQDNAMGGSSVVGQYVSSEGSKTPNFGNGFHQGLGKESRHITLQNGKRKIQQLGVQLKLNQHCIDIAYNFFKMAVNKRLTRGRKTSHVVAACLYMVCRTEGTPHMLLDFSDILQANVYQLGRTYLQLSRELHINAPALDPCLYIHRFAHKLEFEKKTHEVSMCALRLVSRMKRDWMAQGRRPSGLCGAALLVAARIHNFNRTIKEIIKVVKIGEGTIRKRLAEFEETPSSQLTIDEFQKIDLEEEMDPPCFTKGKQKAKLAQLDEVPDITQLTAEISALQTEIDCVLEKAAAKRSKRLLDTSDAGSICSSVTDSDQSECHIHDMSLVKTESMGGGDCASNDILVRLGITFDSPAVMSAGGDAVATPIQKLEDESDAEIERLERVGLDSLLMPPPGVTGYPGPRPTAASLGLKESIDECLISSEEPEIDEGDGELDLTGIDDEEINQLILSDEEVKRKTSLWLKANADYLLELKMKEEQEEKERELGIEKPDPKKKKRAPRKKQPKTEATSAGVAIEKMLQEKKISSKINYDVLKDLNKTSSVHPQKPDIASLQRDIISGPIEVTPVTIRSPRLKRPAVKEESLTEKKPKVEKLEVKVEKEKPIVESGPVVYAAEDEAEEEAEDEEEGEDEPQSYANRFVQPEEEYDMYDDEVE